MRGDIRFIYGEQDCSLAGLSPTTTVLEWLRTEARACGTKEGCAEGDCGACTVVLGEPDGQGMRYRPVNACLLFIPALDGRQLLTVEHLAGKDGALHPVQRAMVDHHASQCGFCTPGFVMSLWALHQSALHESGTAVTRAEACEALAGNLCRCTGYRPILDAALEACTTPADDRFARVAGETAARLRALPQDSLAIRYDGQRYAAPATLTEAIELVSDDKSDPLLLAGGTDVALLVTKQRRTLPDILALDRVPELHAVEETEESINIGACVTYKDALPVFQRNWPELAPMLRRLGSRQIRHRGTIGGNLGTASPIGDMAPALIALDGCVRFGARQLPSVAMSKFFVGYRRTELPPGEFILRVEIPRRAPGDVVAIYKVSKRFEEDISSVCVAFRLRLDEAGAVADLRAGFGGMAATPIRAVALEHALIGQPWTRETVEHGMHVLDVTLRPLGDMRASAAYRSLVARNLLLKFWLETSGQDVRTRIEALAA